MSRLVTEEGVLALRDELEQLEGDEALALEERIDADALAMRLGDVVRTWVLLEDGEAVAVVHATTESAVREAAAGLTRAAHARGCYHRSVRSVEVYYRCESTGENGRVVVHLESTPTACPTTAAACTSSTPPLCHGDER